MIPNVVSFIIIIALGLEGVQILELRWGWGCTLTVLKTLPLIYDGKSYTVGAGQGAKGSTDFVPRWGRNCTLYQRLHLNPRPLVLDFTVLISLDVFSDCSQLKSTKTKLKIQKDSNISPDILGLFTTPAPSQLEPQLTSTGILARF